MIKLGPLLMFLWLFCRFLSLIAIDKKNQHSLSSSRDQRSERRIFEKWYATAFYFVVSGSEALYSVHSPVI